MKKYGFISAGEFSGDLLAAELILELRKIGFGYEWAGICGERMVETGIASLVSQDDVNVMGVFEIFRRLPQLADAEQKILSWVDRFQPEFAVLVDFPGFHLMLAEKFRLRNIPVFQYIAPKLWAWGESRARKLRENVSLTLGMFPFETSFFSDHQVPFLYVGCPLVDRVAGVSFNRSAWGISLDVPVVALLLGSRKEEISRLLDVTLEVIQTLSAEVPHIQFLWVVASNISLEWMQTLLGELPPQVRFVQGKNLEAMAVADAAVICSGTATLECALLGTPLCVMYKMNGFTYEIAKRKVKISWISLVNILAKKSVVKEFIQEFEASDIKEEIIRLLFDQDSREKMQSEFADIKKTLSPHASASAAQAISHFLRASSI